MIRLLPYLALLPLLVAGCGDTPADGTAANSSAPTGNVAEAQAPKPLPDIVRVRLETEAGPIVVALDAKRAPVTTANFVRYVEEGRFDGTSFYRAARTKGAASRGFIQGGIRRNYRRMLPPIAHEPTTKTGLSHVDGAVSMARGALGSARSDFFISIGDLTSLDADPSKPGDNQGFAVFGRVVEGMDVVRKIMGAPTSPTKGEGAMKGQMIAAPVKIVSARRTPVTP